MLYPVCILAGGRGTRLGSITKSVPKPLVHVSGEPFLLHQLRYLAAEGVTRVVLCVGHLGEQIEEAIGPQRFGISLSYCYDSPALDGTLGAIRNAQSLLGERFLVLYGDTFLPVAFSVIQKRWDESGLPAMMTVLRNDNRWGRSNVVYGRNKVLQHDKLCSVPAMRWIDYGLGGLSKEALAYASGDEADLSALYGVLAERRLLCGIPVKRRFHEIGTPEALIETERFIKAWNARRSGPQQKPVPS